MCRGISQGMKQAKKNGKRDRQYADEDGMSNIRRHGCGFHTLEIIDVGNVENRYAEEKFDLRKPRAGLWQSVTEHPNHEKRNPQPHAKACHQTDATQCSRGCTDAPRQLSTCRLTRNIKQNGARNRANARRNNKTCSRTHQEGTGESIPSACCVIQFGYE